MSYYSIGSFCKSLAIDQTGAGDYPNIHNAANSAYMDDVIMSIPITCRESIMIASKKIMIIGDGPDATFIYISSKYAVIFGDNSNKLEVIGFSIASSGETAIYTEYNC